jgi:hypothetical protein
MRPREERAVPVSPPAVQRNALRDAILSARGSGAGIAGSAPADVLRSRLQGKTEQRKEAPPARAPVAASAPTHGNEISPDDLRKILNGA